MGLSVEFTLIGAQCGVLKIDVGWLHGCFCFHHKLYKHLWFQLKNREAAVIATEAL